MMGAQQQQQQQQQQRLEAVTGSGRTQNGWHTLTMFAVFKSSSARTLAVANLCSGEA